MAVMSCQLLLLYSLIVERSVSHPVRLTAGVPLVTPQCPVPADAIVAAPAAEERSPGPAGCETILGRKRRESRSCVQKPGQPSVSESAPLRHPASPLPWRICHPLISCARNRNLCLTGYFTGLVHSSLSRRCHHLSSVALVKHSTAYKRYKRYIIS